jgi:hypothetical protein
MPPLGAVHYLVLARRRQTLGRYRFGYRRGRVAAESVLGPTIPAA